jgi:hypothetical protein
MKQKRFTHAWLAAGLLFAGAASAATGPTQSPLKVTAMYTKDLNGAIYVAFQTGAMPGCYANQGGYLMPTNSAFKELYAQLMLMVAKGGVRAAVVYTQNTPTNNWSDCTIDGIFLLPE